MPFSTGVLVPPDPSESTKRMRRVEFAEMDCTTRKFTLRNSACTAASEALDSNYTVRSPPATPGVKVANFTLLNRNSESTTAI